MQLTARSGDLLHEPADLAVLITCAAQPLPVTVTSLFESADFQGMARQTLLVYPRGNLAPRRLLLVGLGMADAVTAEHLRWAAALATRRAQDMAISAFTLSITAHLPLTAARIGEAIAEGIALGGYRYLRYRTKLTEALKHSVEHVTIMSDAASVAEIRKGLATGQIIAHGVTFARDLVNGPGSVITPAALGDEALALGKRLGLRVTVLDKAELVTQKFGGILAVGQGSANDPRFIVMEYGQSRDHAPALCLVGKGITFDAGGLSLKPAEAMEAMKSDMGGAAAVFGVMQAVAELALPVRVIGIICAAENMPSATAFRPGDIVTTLSGTTVEVLNTDAEGRIILADGLFYAQRYQPAAIIDLATLTGAILIALGPHAIGMMGTNQELADQLRQAGEASAERLWQLPLWDDYRAMIISDVADLKNLGGRAAGSITAAAFLAAFVGEYPWVHLDIAGTAWLDKPTTPYEQHGGTGVGVRLLVDFLRTLHGSSQQPPVRQP